LPADPPGPARPPGPGEAFFRVLIENSADVIILLGGDGTVRYATPSAAALFGAGPDIIGARLADLASESARDDVDGTVTRMLAGPGPAPDGETWRLTGADGQDMHVEVRGSDLRGASEVAGIMLTLRDVTAQRAAESDLRHRALHDALTGLPNRVAFADRARHAADMARRTATTAAVLYIDLDDFKSVNDTLGHQAGDELLQAVAGRLQAVARRGSDTAARLGGDEFAMISEGLPAPAAAGELAGRVVHAFSEPFSLHPGQDTVEVRIGVSVGVATTADSGDIDEIHRCADLALYAAKAAGKQTWRAYDPTATAAMPAPAESRARAAEVSGLGFPDPRPGLAGPGPRSGPVPRPAPEETRRRPRPGP
jgi:diguanylate cyclase (GGDEF)-like protein/PAS domain S-box-containing protein